MKESSPPSIFRVHKKNINVKLEFHLISLNYPLEDLQKLALALQAILSEYRIGYPMPTRRGETEEERKRIWIEEGIESQKFTKEKMAKANEMLPYINEALAKIEALLESENPEFASRILSVIEDCKKETFYLVNFFSVGELSSNLMRLKGHLTIRAIARPTIFVGYRYTPEDELLADKFIKLLFLEGFNPTSAKTARAEDIDDKVKKMIELSDGVTIIFTREEELQKGGYTTSTWLSDEKSYALGKDKKVTLFFEDMIAPSQRKGIQGDLEYIEFNRDHLENCILEAIPYLRDFRQRIISE